MNIPFGLLMFERETESMAIVLCAVNQQVRTANDPELINGNQHGAKRLTPDSCHWKNDYFRSWQRSFRRELTGSVLAKRQTSRLHGLGEERWEREREIRSELKKADYDQFWKSGKKRSWGETSHCKNETWFWWTRRLFPTRIRELMHHRRNLVKWRVPSSETQPKVGDRGSETWRVTGFHPAVAGKA